MKRLFAFLYSALYVLILISAPAHAAKPVLVLLPIEVSESEADLEDEYGSALQEGLQTRYEVYYGPSVEKELDREYEKLDCSAESCNQNVAIAFNGELIADGSVTKLGGGYIIKVVIRNVVSGKIIESRTVPCQQCTPFDLIAYLRDIGNGKTSNLPSASSVATKPPNDQAKAAILIFDSSPSGAQIVINGSDMGMTPYQGLSHHLGEHLAIVLKKTDYQDLSFEIDLLQAINKPSTYTLNKALATPLSEVIVAVNGRLLTQEDLDISWQYMYRLFGSTFAPEKTLNELINLYVLIDEAEKLQLRDKPAYRQAELTLESFRETIGNDDLFNRVLLASAYKHYFFSHLKVPDSLANAQEYHAQQIFVKSKRVAKRVIKYLKKGQSFADLASKYSEDIATKDKGGDVGWILLKNQKPEIAEALLQLEDKAFSLKPIKVAGGYHILMRSQSRTLSGQALNVEFSKYQQLQMANNMKTLIAQAQVEIFKKGALPNLAEGESVSPGSAAQLVGRVRASHILVSTEKEARQIIVKLQSGADFSDLAKRYSTGPSAPKGGELGWFLPDQMVPTFAAEVRSLKVGQFSSRPIKTQFGYHIVKVSERGASDGKQ